MLGTVVAMLVAFAATSGQATVPLHMPLCCPLRVTILIQGLGAHDVGKSGHDVADCHSYYAKVKVAGRSVQTAQMQPAGEPGRCSFSFSGPIRAPFDLYIGFGSATKGWQISHRRYTRGGVNESLRVSFTFRKIDIENKINSSAYVDDWSI